MAHQSGSADIRDGNLPWLLEQITSATGWQVYVEPDVSRVVSAKFENLPPGEALRLLLGDLNFALIPQANANPKLFVFETTLGMQLNVWRFLILPDRSIQGSTRAGMVSVVNILIAQAHQIARVILALPGTSATNRRRLGAQAVVEPTEAGIPGETSSILRSASIRSLA